jgi:ABC-type Fe3+/spermidine/putrescine transport system ATPase subunit
VATLSEGEDSGPVSATAREEGPAVECRGLVVAYGAQEVVRGMDLVVRRGETVALLGPSGSGKTTLLYAVAGFLAPRSGEIRLAGRVVATPARSEPPERRAVGMVFQHYGLWPHMDARDTVAYPLRRAGRPTPAARQEAQRLLDQVGIGQLAARRPAALSGGEQQRVGLARALARRPGVYLLDEPTAHLDAALRTELQAELAARVHADGAAAIHATHDVEEALAIADRVVLLREGRVAQSGSPEDVYARPADVWAARLTGPAAFIRGRVEDAGGGPAFASVAGRWPLDVPLDAPADAESLHLVRPDWVRFGGPIGVRVEDVRFRGSHTDYRLATPAGAILLREPGPPRHAPGDAATCRIVRLWPVAGSADPGPGDAGPGG